MNKSDLYTLKASASLLKQSAESRLEETPNDILAKLVKFFLEPLDGQIDEIIQKFDRLHELEWEVNPDKMGGQFTQEEIDRVNNW